MRTANLKVTRKGHVVDVHRVHVQLNNGERISGIVNIAENNCQRLSELFTRDKTGFLVMSKCNTPHRTMFINKQSIVWAAPDED